MGGGIDKDFHTAETLLTPVVDMWSYGALLYEARTRRPMFRSDRKDVQAWVQASVETRDMLKFFMKTVPGQRLEVLPPDSADLIFRCCHRLPSKRLSTPLGTLA